jgi:hypothetical protein
MPITLVIKTIKKIIITTKIAAASATVVLAVVEAAVVSMVAVGAGKQATLNLLNMLIKTVA